jgi:hypothetical protein
MIVCTSVNADFLPGFWALAGSLKRYEPDAVLVAACYDVDAHDRNEMECAGIRMVRGEGDARLHGKALATYQGMLAAMEQGDSELLHVDSDAWLLSGVKDAFEQIPGDGMLAFRDAKPGSVSSQTVEELFGRTYKPIPFNAGVVFYRLGAQARDLIGEFHWSVEDKGRQNRCGNQQILRILARKYESRGLRVILSDDSTHWNPVWKRAENLKRKGRTNTWINQDTGKRQRIFHAAGGANRKKGRNKPWQEPDKWSASALETFRFVREMP